MDRAIPFESDKQFNIRVDMKLGESSIHNLKIDYGSNWTLSLPEDAFAHIDWKKRNLYFEEYDSINKSLSSFTH